MAATVVRMYRTFDPTGDVAWTEAFGYIDEPHHVRRRTTRAGSACDLLQFGSRA
jgi:hypothetical protein